MIVSKIMHCAGKGKWLLTFFLLVLLTACFGAAFASGSASTHYAITIDGVTSSGGSAQSSSFVETQSAIAQAVTGGNSASELSW